MQIDEKKFVSLLREFSTTQKEKLYSRIIDELGLDQNINFFSEVESRLPRPLTSEEREKLKILDRIGNLIPMA